MGSAEIGGSTKWIEDNIAHLDGPRIAGAHSRNPRENILAKDARASLV
jgi:hypothetical protein